MTNPIKEKVKMVISYLRYARIARKYTEKYLASKLHLPQDDYTKIESGEIALTLEQFFQIADVLELDAKELLEAALWSYDQADKY